MHQGEPQGNKKSLRLFSLSLFLSDTHTHWFWFSSKKKKFDKYSKHVAMKCIRRLTFCVIVRMWYKNYLQGMCHDRGICQVPKLWTFGDAWFRMFAYSVYVRGCVCVTFAYNALGSQQWCFACLLIICTAKQKVFCIGKHRPRSSSCWFDVCILLLGWPRCCLESRLTSSNGMLLTRTHTPELYLHTLVLNQLHLLVSK